MPEPIVIGSREVGDDRPVFIVAEAGSNHNRDFKQAIALVDAAAQAGADAVKFQLFTAERLYPRSAGRSEYLGRPESIYEIIDAISLPPEWIPDIAAHCRSNGIEFMATGFDERSAAIVDGCVNVHKIASYELTHAPLNRTIARFGKPIIMSTGGADLDEVQAAVRVIRAEGNERLVVCQCTAKYPAPLDALNLRAIPALRAATGCHVGFSDHSREPIVAPIAALALGACVIEKHFTLDNDLPGPDQRFALEPHELNALVAAIRAAEQALGRGEKRVLPIEEELRSFARRSIFTTRVVEKGEPLTADSIAVLRCGERGTGLSPDQYDAILGRKAVRELPAETLLSLADLQ